MFSKHRRLVLILTTFIAVIIVVVSINNISSSEKRNVPPILFKSNALSFNKTYSTGHLGLLDKPLNITTNDGHFQFLMFFSEPNLKDSQNVSSGYEFSVPTLLIELINESGSKYSTFGMSDVFMTYTNSSGTHNLDLLGGTFKVWYGYADNHSAVGFAAYNLSQNLMKQLFVPLSGYQNYSPIAKNLTVSFNLYGYCSDYLFYKYPLIARVSTDFYMPYMDHVEY